MSNEDNKFDRDVKDFFFGVLVITGISGIFTLVFISTICAFFFGGAVFGMCTILLWMVIVSVTSLWVLGDGNVRRGIDAVLK